MHGIAVVAPLPLTSTSRRPVFARSKRSAPSSQASGDPASGGGSARAPDAGTATATSAPSAITRRAFAPTNDLSHSGNRFMDRATFISRVHSDLA